MDRKEAVELSPYIKAFGEGKEIEMRSKNPQAQLNGWTKMDEFIFGNFEYRIKPESKFRPFKDAEECWAEMKKHEPFGWVKLKATGKYFIHKAVGSYFAVVGISDRPTNYDELLKEYTFADGTPFGVKVEE